MAALIKLPCPSPFSFPGGNPGLDPSHVAANGIVRYSGIASGKNFISLLNGSRASAGGSLVQSIDGLVGPGSSTLSGGSLLISGQPLASDSIFTMAAIVRMPNPYAASTAMIFCTDNGLTAGLNFESNNTGGLNIGRAGAGGNSLSGFTLAAGGAYFVAFSQKATSGAGNANFILVDLSTGVTLTSSQAGGTTLATTTGTYSIGSTGGNRNWSNTNSTGVIAAVMFSTAGLSPPQLREWAQDPWAFWYP